MLIIIEAMWSSEVMGLGGKITDESRLIGIKLQAYGFIVIIFSLLSDLPFFNFLFPKPFSG